MIKHTCRNDKSVKILKVRLNNLLEQSGINAYTYNMKEEYLTEDQFRSNSTPQKI